VHPLDYSSCLARRWLSRTKYAKRAAPSRIATLKLQPSSYRLMLDDELNGATAGVSSHIGTDNKATEGWYNRKASRASHKAPERFLRWLAMRQR
jgi:hypothetical protein